MLNSVYAEVWDLVTPLQHMHSSIYRAIRAALITIRAGRVDQIPKLTLRNLLSIAASFCCRSASSPRPEKSVRKLAVRESTTSSLKQSSAIIAAKEMSRSESNNWQFTVHTTSNFGSSSSICWWLSCCDELLMLHMCCACWCLLDEVHYCTYYSDLCMDPHIYCHCL